MEKSDRDEWQLQVYQQVQKKKSYVNRKVTEH
jgi:hypothetical protein